MSILVVDDDDEEFFSEDESVEAKPLSSTAPSQVRSSLVAVTSPRVEKQEMNNQVEGDEFFSPQPQANQVVKNNAEETEQANMKATFPDSSKIPSNFEGDEKVTPLKSDCSPEKPPMVFSFEPMEDILTQEARSGHLLGLAKAKKVGVPKKHLGRADLARLSQPKVQRAKVRAEKKDQKPPEGSATKSEWGTWEDDDVFVVGDDDDEGDLGKEKCNQDARAAVASVAGSKTPKRPNQSPGKLSKTIEIAENSPPKAPKFPAEPIFGHPTADKFYVCVLAAGRPEHGFALDRKTLLASMLELVDLPPQGVLLHRGLPVHTHASAVTLGLRPGIEHVVTLRFAFPIEREEENTRHLLVAQQIGCFTHLLADLHSVLVKPRLPRKQFVDACDDFEDVNVPLHFSSPETRFPGGSLQHKDLAASRATSEAQHWT